jgi:bla regulator protein BlaR1
MNFSGFAVAALARVFEATWHASLLIVLTLAIQELFRSKIPPAWKYALWLPVVLRLLLPSVPESGFSLLNLGKAASHFHKADPKIKVETNLPPPTGFSFPNAQEVAGNVEIPVAESAAPKSKIDMFALAAEAWLLGCAALTLRTLAGACWFARRLRAEKIVDPVMLEELERAKHRVNYKSRVLLLASGAVASPVLFGLLRPALLVPRDLGQRLAREELQHVLAHEIAHLKRRDLIASWLMVCAQIVHWFNPLVWLALARCRADRELACDALALSRFPREEATSYGRTILKLLDTFPAARPAAGLVGILEGKAQMKKRIELVTNYAPQKGFSWFAAGLLCCLAISGLSKATAESAGSASDTIKSDLVVALAPATDATNILDRVRFQNVSVSKKSLDDVLKAISIEILKQEPKPTNLFQLLSFEKLHSITNETEAAENAKTYSVHAVNPIAYVNSVPGGPESFGKDVLVPSVHLTNTSLRDALSAIIANSGQQISWYAENGHIILSVQRSFGGMMISKSLPTVPMTQENSPAAGGTNMLDRIRIQNVLFNGKTLDKVLQLLQTMIADQNPSDTNLFRLQRHVTLKSVNATGYINDAPEAAESFGRNVFVEPMELRDASLRDVLNTIVAKSNRKLEWWEPSRKSYILFTLATPVAKSAEPEALYTRTYKVEPSEFLPAVFRSLGKKPDSASGTNDVQKAVREFLVGKGFEPVVGSDSQIQQKRPPGKAIFYSTDKGILFVRGTLKDLDHVESALQSISSVTPPRINAQVRIILLKRENGLDALLGLAESNKLDATHGIAYRSGAKGKSDSPAPSGIFRRTESDVFEQEAKKLSNVEMLAAPSVTTLSGRQARVSIEPGPSVDVLPVVQPNGTAIYIRAEVTIPAPDGKAPAAKLMGTATVADGQSMLLMGAQNDAGMRTIVLIKPQIFDAKGNPVYTGNSVPDTIPPQNLE